MGNQDRDNNSNKNLRKTENNWNRVRDQFREKYPQLSNEDTKYRTGEFENMTERIAKKTNRTRQDVQNEIDNWDYDNYENESDNYRNQRYQNL
jgi:hypothetical protein